MSSPRTARTAHWLAACLLVSAAVLGPARPGRAAPEIVRHSGATRYETAAAVSASTFDPGVQRVFLATGRDFPDALAAVPVAGPAGDPLLLVGPDTVPAATAAELDRLDPASITILGGANAVSRRVLDEARQYTDGPVRRIDGATRYHTAAELVDIHFGPGVPVVYVATGTSSADSLTGGPAAAAAGGPLLLVRPDAIPEPTAATLLALDPERIVILGGTSAVGTQVEEDLADHTDGEVTRLAGSNRYDTAATVVHEVFPGMRATAWMTTGTTYPDGLTGGVAAASRGEPLVTVRPDCVPPSTLPELERMDLDRVTVLGGPRAVSDDAASLVACEPGLGLHTSTIASGLDVPWDLVFTPGGRTFLTERDNGRVLELHDDGSTREVISFTTVDNDHEGGLTGLAVHPAWNAGQPASQWLYALYVHEDATDPGELDQRVVRFHPDGSGLEQVITGLPHDGGQSHFAGRIDFGPDGMLWVSIGDVRDAEAAQDPHSLKGKILRYEPDGTVPADNPIPVDPLDPDGAREPVWAMGFRDPQGMAWDDAGRMYASEFGPNQDDEVNLVVAGGNYGWPCVTGTNRPQSPWASEPPCQQAGPDFEPAIVVRQPPVASWSGASVLSGGAIPAWEGDLFVAALRGQRLYRVDLEDGLVQDVEELLVGQYGRLRHVTPAPDGSLWLVTSNQDDNGAPVPGDDRIIRLGP